MSETHWLENDEEINTLSATEMRCLRGDHEQGDIWAAQGARIAYVCKHCRCIYPEEPK